MPPLSDADLSLLRSALKEAAKALAKADTALKNKALKVMAQAIKDGSEEILAANAEDVSEARAKGRPSAFLDRLALNPARLDDLARSLEEVAFLADPVGRIEDYKRLPNGLEAGRLRIPLGIVGFICEARPGALVEAGAICLKSGNAVIIKTGRETARASRVLGRLIGKALIEAGLPAGAIIVAADYGPEELASLLAAEDLLEVAIPRGGPGLIGFVERHSRAPVLRHYRGVCHTYVDESADLDLAVKIIINGKAQRPATCNSLEAVVVHRGVAPALLPRLAEALTAAGVEIRACPEALPLMPGARAAEPDDFGREFLALILAVKVAPDFEAALGHIARYGSNHTETIVTADHDRAQRFLREADAGTVMVNASTRLNDGGVLGLGAEIGISTSKIHAYGPMGLKEMTTCRFIVLGRGHLRE